MRAAIKAFDDEEESGARPPPKVGERLQIHYEGTGGGWYWGKVLEVEPLKAAEGADASSPSKGTKAKALGKRTRSEDPPVGEMPYKCGKCSVYAKLT